MHAGSLIAALPTDYALTLVDVGSAGGLHQRWSPLGGIISAILFDPRGPRASGALGRGATRVYPVALGKTSGSATLHLTAMENMSSFLEPDPEAMARYGKTQRDSAVVGTQNVQIERLDALATRDGFAPHVAKIDTQGSELDVLMGARQSLRSVMLAEVEVSFFARYRGQPLFAQVEQFMNAQDFELVEFHRLKRYRSANSLGIRNIATRSGDHSGRLAFGDAIFMRNEDGVLAASRADGGASLLHAIVALAAYAKADMAARLLDLGRATLQPEQAEKLGRALAALRQGGPGWLEIAASKLRSGRGNR